MKLLQEASSERSSEDLLYAYSKGDHRSFEELYNRHKVSIKRFIQRYTKNQASTDDIAQLVWVRVIESASRLEAKHSDENNPLNFKAYLYTIAGNLIKDGWRSTNSRPVAADVDVFLFEDSESVLAPELISISQLYECIDSKLERFKQGFIDAFRLTRDGELGYAEAAKVLGINVETLRSRVKSVLVSVKPCLEAHKNG
jgi:RNA polymerase sigma-70 factor, ECF subfamily